jgi:hypothetical protein
MVSSYSTGIMGSTNEYTRAQELAYDKVTNEFGSTPYNCADLDLQIKRISEKLLSERKKDPLPSSQQKVYMEQLELKKSAWEGMWATNGCKDIIENIRLQSMAVVETSSAIKQEESVLDKGKKDQSLYIGLGGVVLLIGLYIVLNK